MKATHLLACILLLIAPASFAEYAPRFYFSSVGVANLTGSTVTEVELRVGSNKLNCESVNNNGYCHKRFGKLPFTPDEVALSWTDADGKQRESRVGTKIPATTQPGNALRLELEMHPGGDVKWELRQGGKKA